MLRLLFAFALLTAAATSPPAAAGLGVAPTDTANASVSARAEGWFCMAMGGYLYCDPLPPGGTCETVRALYDAHNGSQPPSNQYDGFKCWGAAVAAFDGQQVANEGHIMPEGFMYDIPFDPPSGDHIGVVMMYVQDGHLHAIEAGEGSDFGALVDLADDCDSRRRPFTVTTQVMDGPGTLRVNGHRIEIERVTINVYSTGFELYNEILIRGEPIEFEE